MPTRTRASLTIRQYRRSDDPEIWGLAELTSGGAVDSQAPLPLVPAAAPPEDCPDLADVGAHYLVTGGDFLVAVGQRGVVGTAGLVLAGDREADIVRLVVHPAVRRQGIGTALLEAVERRAVELGIRRLHLDVGDDARDAIAFYRSAGFRRRDRGEEGDADERWEVRFFSKAL